MGRKRKYLASFVMALVCLAVVTPVSSAAKRRPKPVYSTGTYAGTLDQREPFTIRAPIRFAVSGRTLSGLNVTVAELCAHTIWTAVTDVPKTFRVSIAADGSFSYDKTVLGDHLLIKGHLRGVRAAGTFFDSLTAGQLVCAMPAASPFTAKR